MNRLLMLLFLSSNTFFVASQQETNNTFFWRAQLYGNPAFTGIDSRHEANALYRNQWDKVNGAPNTLFFNYAAQVKKLHGGAGISYKHEAIGFNRQHQVLGHYAFHQKLGTKYVLSGGISLGWMRISIDPDWIASTTLNDPSLPGNNVTNLFQLNAGMAFIAENWRVGFGSTQLNSGNRTSSGAYSPIIHSRLFGEYRFLLTEKLTLIPRVQISTDYVKFSDQLFLGLYSGRLWGGVNYSGIFGSNYLGAMIGYDFKGKYRVGYSYDYSTNKLSNISRGTHEIVLSFSLDGFQQKPFVLQEDEE